jgi:hypothetical protein
MNSSRYLLSRLEAYLYCFMCGRPSTHILKQTHPAGKGFCDIPQSFQENFRTVPQIRPLTLPSIPSPIHCHSRQIIFIYYFTLKFSWITVTIPWCILEISYMFGEVEVYKIQDTTVLRVYKILLSLFK